MIGLLKKKMYIGEHYKAHFPPIQFSKETEKLIWTHRPCIIYMKYQIKA